MLTTEQFLRRSLLAPIMVPVIAFIAAGIAQLQGIDPMGDTISTTILSTLGLSFAFGIIPYLWMMHVEWSELRWLTSNGLEKAILQLPMKMLPYFLKVMGIVILLLLITVVGAVGAIYMLICTVIGAVAIPVIGYVYIGITFGFLRAFQAMGIVERTA